jgi:predicted 3-demethylubiquinone-9 3-methyltransferase (glyoxalase superfamily)
MNPRIRTCLWFHGNGEEAVNFYVSLIPNSRVEKLYRPCPNDPAVLVDFSLDGTPYQAVNGGSTFTLSEAASISVLTPHQEETDRLWNGLALDGGREGQCGWLVDRYGLSWQIVPEAVPRLLGDSDPDAVRRVMLAIVRMKKINIAELESAHRGPQKVVKIMHDDRLSKRKRLNNDTWNQHG